MRRFASEESQGRHLSPERWRPGLGYVAAVGLTAAAAVIRWWLPGIFDGAPYLTFYPAVVASAALGGLGPGLLATAGSVLCVDLLFDKTPGRIDLRDHVAMARLLIFLAGGIGTSLLAGLTRRRARAVAASEQRLRANFDNAALGIIEVDEQDRTIAANARFSQILGYDPGELIGRSVHELTWSEDRPLSDMLNQELHTGQRGRIDYEKRYVRKDGLPVWVHVTVMSIRDAAGRIIRSIGTVEDIGQRKEAEQRVLQLNRDLQQRNQELEEDRQALRQAKLAAEAAQAAAEQANSAKDHFLAVLSHELRTPLTPVLAMVSMLQSDRRFDEDARDSLTMVRRNVEMEARLIDDLLDITRIARGKIVLDRRPVRLCEVIGRAVDVCRSEILSRRLGLAMDVDSCGAIAVDGDAARLQQVFWNLLINAIKFTPSGGQVSIRASRENGTARVEVCDTGVGIEPEALTRIFGAFEQAEQSITRQFDGLGLGLAISKAIVEMHGGAIWAESDGRGRGARFHVRLPVAAGAQAEPKQPCDNGRQAARPGLRILLVEDHQDTATILQRVLASEGHEVRVAEDAAAALELAGSEGFDLLLSDLGLPDASGLDLLRELRKRGHRFPGIALSGYGQEEDVRRSRDAGFAEHLTKPTSPDRLVATISTVAARPATMEIE